MQPLPLPGAGAQGLLFPNSPSVRIGVQRALTEDLGSRGDITTDAIYSPKDEAVAELIAKEDLVFCGGPILPIVFGALSDRITIRQFVAEGARVRAGERLAELQGPTRALLAGERTGLNFLQRMSGVATVTARYVSAAGPRLKIYDTRKTNPAWRELDRYAVRCGGGCNNRFGLYDMMMIKDTHADAAGGLAVAIRRVSHLRGEFKLSCEARNLAEVEIAAEAGVDLLMLDNMDDDTIARAAAIVRGRCPIEVTGGVTIERLPKLARLGVDRVSVGALTHSARAVDISMKTHAKPAAGPAVPLRAAGSEVAPP